MAQAKFEEFTITPDMGVEEWNFDELDGVLDKFWIHHSQLGNSLVKIDRKNYAESWSEKVAAELSSQLAIPYTKYKLGTLIGFDDYKDGTQVIISPNFELEGHDYAQGIDLLNEISPDFDYTVNEVISALEIADVQLPLNYKAPEGINNGADLFVGYLVLDSLIDNFDRHQRNWGYNTSEQDDIKRLTPTYDHGVSLGAILDSNDLKTIDINQYNKFSKSSFGTKHKNVIKQAAKLRPQATKIWLEQLSTINQEQIKAVFDRLPSNRITPEFSKFAQELIDFNQAELLSMAKDIRLEVEQEKSATPYQLKLRQNYLNAKQEVLKPDFSASQQGNLAFDVAIAKHLRSKSYSTHDIAATLAQSDHVYDLLKEHRQNLNHYRQQVAKYIYSVGTKAGLSFNQYVEQNQSPQKQRKKTEIER